MSRVWRYEAFRAVLITAQQSRELMPMVDLDTPYWNTYEKLVMWREVNARRAGHDKKPVPFSDIERVEQMAAGHFDYTTKFALYCSELVDEE